MTVAAPALQTDGVTNGDHTKEEVNVVNGQASDTAIVEKLDVEAAVVEKPEYGPPEDMTLLKLFLTFLRFGFLAVGGPVQQIAMMKQELVINEKWTSISEFNKVFAVYQALPGPEATEIASYFGLLSHGRIGGLLTGLGFILPGFGIMMLLAYLYIHFNLFSNKGFLASFHCVRPCIPAMAVRAVIKISEHALVDHSGASKEISPILLFCAAMGFLLTIFQTPFFVTLGFAGLVHVAYKSVHWTAGWALAVLGIVGNVIYVSLQGLSNPIALAAGTATGNIQSSIFVTGLLAGCTTFGGAFTAVPYVLRSFVLINKFMTTQQFLDGIAVVNFVPTPLVMFVTWDGFVAGGVSGAILMTLGMFLPSFFFVIAMHDMFMYLCKDPKYNAFFEGISAAVVGLISESACQLTKAAVHNGMDTLVFTCTLLTLTQSTNKNTPLLIIFAAAMAGQVLYLNNANSLSS